MNSFVNEIVTDFEEIKPFRFAINYAELDEKSPDNVHISHFHDGCEIYINLSGDVSFMVENHLYPINNGDIVITKPFEYHNCIYNKNVLHRQYCIIFSCDGNEKLLEVFFNRDKGKHNLVRLTKDKLDEVVEYCDIFLLKRLSSLEKYSLFIRILSILSTSTSKEQPDMMPAVVKPALDYISQNISKQITVEQLANVSHVSVNTLERHFKDVLGVSPSSFVKNKRLSEAARLLRKGASVTEACFDSGFVNCSHFIAQFKKHFGITPNKYRRFAE